VVFDFLFFFFPFDEGKKRVIVGFFEETRASSFFFFFFFYNSILIFLELFVESDELHVCIFGSIFGFFFVMLVALKEGFSGIQRKTV
jgi:hypothetical protein